MKCIIKLVLLLNWLGVNFLLIGCLAVSEREVPKGAKEIIERTFSAGTTNLLIVPLVKAFPFLYSDNKSDSCTYLVGPPIFTTSALISNLPSLLYMPKSFGLVGPDTQFGKEFLLDGVWIIASSGSVVWLENNQFPSDLQWTNIQMGWLGPTWVKDLISGIQKDRRFIDETPSPTSFWGGLSYPKGDKQFVSKFSSSDVIAVCKFLKQVRKPIKNITTDIWVKRKGESE